MKSVYKKLVSFEEAVHKAFESIELIREEEYVDIRDSLGRILSEGIYSSRNNPPFNRATMDGYAVRSVDLAGASAEHPVTLSVSGESFIGDPRKNLQRQKSCFKISTGAIVPSGADAVVKVESTLQSSSDAVQIFETVEPTENVAEAGSDISSNELLIMPGKEIESSDIAVLAALGIPNIKVYRKLRVNILSTGNELISYKEQYSEGKINDANGVVLTSELNSFSSIRATYSGIVKDDYPAIKKQIERGLEENDVTILSGGSSAGESDLVYRIIEELEPGMVFHGILVKPGLPTVLGKKGNGTIIGLPGFPVSSLMIFRSIFLVPLLRASRCYRIPENLTGKLGVNVKLEMGKQNLLPVSISGREPRKIYPVTGLSGSISRFVSTSGFLSLPGTAKYLEAGTEVEVTLWNSRIEPGKTIISGLVFGDLFEPFGQVSDNTSFYRMMPKDSLKALANGDSDLSVFVSSTDFDIKSYVADVISAGKCLIYRGNKQELVLGSKIRHDSLDSVDGAVRSGSSFSGPSLRFLKNITKADQSLNQIIGLIETNISSYVALSLDESAQRAATGESVFSITTLESARKRNLHVTEIAGIMPVYVMRDSMAQSLMKSLGIENIVEIS